MLRRESRQQRSMFSLAGWLFADLFLVLTMLFFTSATPWVTRNPPSNPQICGMEQKISSYSIKAPDPNGLRQQHNTSAINSFNAVVKKTLGSDTKKVAGFVEVFGGNPYGNVPDGQNFAAGAIKALKVLGSEHFIFTSQTLYFDPQWAGYLPFNEVKIFISYFLFSTSCQTQK
jgi:hypothetical protein